MNPVQLIKPLLYSSSGKPTLLLNLRVHMARYAATRGWVIPFLTVRNGIFEKWRTARKGGNIGYHHYLEMDDPALRLLGQVTCRVSAFDPILDLGCNVGRDLNHLWKLGYRNLTGVEIGEEPVKAMREVFPEMSAGSRIINKSMTEAIRGFQDGEFHLVYAHGSLVSLSARDQYVFDEMRRVTRKYIVLMENEWSGMLFPRDFGKVFTSRGMKQIHEQEVQSEGLKKKGAKTTMLRVFEKSS
jgi:SAM-dependent methyltransferase